MVLLGVLLELVCQGLDLSAVKGIRAQGLHETVWVGGVGGT